MTRTMVVSFLNGIDIDHEDYSDETGLSVRKFVSLYRGVGLSRIVLDSTDTKSDSCRVSRLLDILIWFPGIDILDFVTELQARINAGDPHTLEIVRSMEAGVADGEDPLAWIVQTFPELGSLKS